MEGNLYSIGNLRAMEIIDIKTGTKLGFIKDLKIDCEEYRIVSLILPSQKMSWFNKNDCIEIPWQNVIKIGVDIILVEAENLILTNKE